MKDRGRTPLPEIILQDLSLVGLLARRVEQREAVTKYYHFCLTA